MKRSLLFLTLFLSLGVVVVMIYSYEPVQAIKTYDARDLSGSYFFVNMEIREEVVDGTTVLDRCSGFGTITFDGVGSATATGTRRCTETGTFVDDTNDFTYTVDAGGSVLITEVGFTDSTHCQIVNKSRMLLCDSVFRNPDIFAVMAIAVKE